MEQRSYVLLLVLSFLLNVSVLGFLYPSSPRLSPPLPSTLATSRILRNHDRPRQTHPYLALKRGGAEYTTVFAGKIWISMQKLILTKAKVKAIITAVSSVLRWQDLFAMMCFVYGPSRISRVVHMLLRKWRNSDVKEEDTTTKFGISNFISEAAQVGLTCYCVDCVALMLSTLGFAWVQKYKVGEIFTRFAYAIWIVRKVIDIKTIALYKAFGVKEDGPTGRLEIMDHLLSGIIATLFGVCLLDSLPFHTDVAVNSILGLGSVGTLTFTLASQGLVTQFLSGLMLTATNKMYAGDFVMFGDGSTGTVIKMGWMETQLRATDNSIIKIPNSQLASQKMSNLSRVTECLVRQTLRFHYEDIDKIPELIQLIRQEIIAACPRLILNGKRPFRVFFTGYREDHLEVEVTTHHRLAPVGDAYHVNRQNVLLAINTAVKKCNMQFAQLEPVSTGREPMWRLKPPE